MKKGKTRSPTEQDNNLAKFRLTNIKVEKPEVVSITCARNLGVDLGELSLVTRTNYLLIRNRIMFKVLFLSCSRKR